MRMKRICKTIALTALMSATTAGYPLMQAQAQDSEYIFGTFFTSNEDTAMQCYLSKDGIHMEHFPFASDIAGRDISCQYYNHSLYICLVEPLEEGDNKESRIANGAKNTFKIYRYTNLENWEGPISYKVIERGEEFPEVWAPDLFIDDDGKAYVYFAKQTGVIAKPFERTFDLYVSKLDNIENFDKESFGSAERVKMNLIKDSKNYIDAQVRKIDGKYYMVAKNESRPTTNDNKTPLLLESNAPDGDFSEIDTWPLKAIRGYEGFCILNKDDKVYIYADNYSLNYDLISNSSHTVWIANKNNIKTGPYKAYYIDCERSLRHGSVLDNFDDYAIDKLKIADFAGKHQLALQNIDEEFSTENPKFITLNAEDYESKVEKDTIIIDNFAPAPGVIYTVPAKKNIVINSSLNPYGVKNVTFSFDDKSSLKIKNLDIVYTKGKEKKSQRTFSVDENGNITDKK